MQGGPVYSTTSVHLIVKDTLKYIHIFSTFSTAAESQVLFNKASYGGA
jgi:hypothetical protein